MSTLTLKQSRMFAFLQADDDAKIKDGSFFEFLPSGAEKSPDEAGKAFYIKGLVLCHFNTHSITHLIRTPSSAQ